MSCNCMLKAMLTDAISPIEIRGIGPTTAVWLATGREIARHFIDHHYDAFARASHPIRDL